MGNAEGVRIRGSPGQSSRVPFPLRFRLNAGKHLIMRPFIVLWILVLTSASVAPWIVKFRLGVNGPGHDLWHFTAFLLTALAFSNGAGKVRGKVLRCAAAITLAAVLETAEVVCYHIRFEWRDVAVDSLGAVAGLTILIFRHIWSATSHRPSSS